MTMSIRLMEIYRCSNIGIFLKSNERFLLVPRGLAIVVFQGEVHGVDPPAVPVTVLLAVGPAHGVTGPDVQFPFQRIDERVEEIQQQTPAAANHPADLVVHERREHDGPHTFHLGGQVDPPHHLLRLVYAVDKWQSHAPKSEPVELGEQAVAEGFRGDPGLVGYEKNRPVIHCT